MQIQLFNNYEIRGGFVTVCRYFVLLIVTKFTEISYASNLNGVSGAKFPVASDRIKLEPALFRTNLNMVE